MIFGNDSKGTIIVARNMIGYDNFIDSNFTKPFLENEPLEVLFPPDHGSSGSNYQFDSPIGETVVGLFSMERGRRTRYFPEESRDRELPYQTEIDITYTPTLNSGIRPISDRGISADNGADAFLLKGSIVRGTKSGAKRFYAGPFKGLTKEIEGVCQGTTGVNLMDGSDCVGYLKGSFYEHSYTPSFHNLFNYSDQIQTIVDRKNAFNRYFMNNTPFGGLNYSWMSVPNRYMRPIPYSMSSNTGKGNAAVLISNRHAIVLSESDVDVNNIRFYDNAGGFTTPSITTSVSTFKEMWDAVGFVNENKDQATLTAFNEMKVYFDGIKVLTFSQNLPSDVVPIRLIDINNSDPLYYSMIISHEGRGHVGTFCPPLEPLLMDVETPPRLIFNHSQSCASIPNRMDHRMTSDRTIGFTRGDVGSPVITYYYYNPVFLGFASESTHQNETVSVAVRGMGIGSSKEIEFPWGAKFTPLSFLNLYLSLSGGEARSIRMLRMDAVDRNIYPYPPSPFNQTMTLRSTQNGGDMGVLQNEGNESENDSTGSNCCNELIEIQKRLAFVIKVKIQCECMDPRDVTGAGDGIGLLNCIKRQCAWLRGLLEELGYPVIFECPSEWVGIGDIPDMIFGNFDFDPLVEKLKRLQRYLEHLIANLQFGPVGLGCCNAFQKFNEDFFVRYVDPYLNIPCNRTNGTPKLTWNAQDFPQRLSQECKDYYTAYCRLHPDVYVRTNTQKMLDEFTSCVTDYWKVGDGRDPKDLTEEDIKKIDVACWKAACEKYFGGFFPPNIPNMPNFPCAVKCRDIEKYILTGKNPCE